MSKTVQDDLAEIVAGGLNKFFKDGKIAYVGGDETPSDLTDFVSTGCALLDLAISNRVHGGIAFGRITYLTGLEASGKSLIAAHIMANVQKMGGVAVLIDSETAVNWEFFDAVGVNTKKDFVYAYLNTIEDMFAATENIIETVRKSSKEKPVVIVLDSIAGATTKKEKADDYERTGYATDKSLLLGQAMRKITQTIGTQKIALVVTNQLRQKMNAMPFQDPWTTPGGKAVDFHSSVRIRLQQTGTITTKDKEAIGVKVKAKITKNRLGPPLRTVDFEIFFDRGIDDVGSWLSFLREKGIVEGAKSTSLTYKTVAGKKIDFSEKEWKSLLESDPDLKEEIYLKLCDACIMSYKTDGLTSEDIETQEGSEEE